MPYPDLKRRASVLKCYVYECYNFFFKNLFQVTIRNEEHNGGGYSQANINRNKMTTIDFSKCFFCRSDDTGDFRDPTKSQKSSVYTLYQNVVQYIIQLKQLNEYLFDIDFQVFEVGEDGLEQAHVNSLERNGAVWHKSCRNKIDNQKVKRAKKKADKAIHTSPRKKKKNEPSL